MKTAKEFVERLQNDEAFVKAVNDGIEARKNAGAKDYTEALIPVAAELGYEITVEQVEALRKKQSEVISEEELGKVAGGTSCLTAAVVLGTLAAYTSATYGITKGVEELVSSSSC